MPGSRFPLAPEVPVGDARYPADEVRAVLAPFLAETRLAAIERVVAARTFDVVPVLEGLVDAGNVNAVLRSAEGLGHGAAHLVGLVGDAARVAAHYLDGDTAEGDGAANGATVRDKRAAKRASSGAHKWVELRAWTDPEAYVRWAHGAGYRVAALALSPGAQPIEAWDATQPTALVVGNERDGVSPAMLAAADATLVLPLDGFVESYNVSVAAALALAHVRAARVARTGRAGTLTPREAEILTAHYVARAVPLAAPILAESRRRAGGEP